MALLSPEFLLTSLIVVASPGTGAIYTIAAGLTQGARASTLAAFACTLGILPHMAAAITGLAALLHQSALAFDLIKYAGVAYLLWMAWLTLQAHGPLQVEGRAPRPARAVLVEGVTINLLNPKLSIFFFAFLPQFVSSTEPSPILTMTGLSLIFMAMTFVVFALYGLFAARMRDQVLSRPPVLAWLRRGFAAAFVILGARLALAQR
ncbi:MAG: LysE family translocator [Tabrizicola sp.]|jgi:threonine/homoserine/homoserine lactone efflux protein|uniref:LysE family translocator n=1 Tax=Tabrizicola sp. TaxID=2005166 RepID=UPI001B42D763|nr:LysE family translocator [Tabrizicola sp.]